MSRQRSIEAGARVDIEASPAVVYKWVTVPDRVVSWVKDLVESRPLEDEPTLTVGARSVEVIKVGRNLVEVPSVVTAAEPDRLAEIRMDMSDGPTTSRALITATSTGCTVEQTMSMEFTGMRLMPSWVLTRFLTHRLNDDLRRLKRLVESD